MKTSPARMLTSWCWRAEKYCAASPPKRGWVAQAPFAPHPPLLFNPTPHYLQRAHTEVRQGLTIIVPHLRDILIAKLHRSRTEGQESLIPKDRRAFQRVRELSGGHPTLAEFLQDLGNCESSFRPPHDGGLNSFRFNAENALLEIYGHHLDLKRDILDPAAIATQPPGHPLPGFIAKQIDGLNA